MRKQQFTLWLVLAVIIVAVYSVVYVKWFSGATRGEQSVTVVLKSLNVRLDFWQAVSQGAETAAKEKGARLEVKGPLQEGDADEQIRILDELIASKPDAIVVAPIADERIPGVLAKVRNAGIRLVVMDSTLELDPPPTIVSNDFAESGRMAGRTAAQEAKGHLAAAVIGDDKNSSITRARLSGLTETLSEYEGGLLGVYFADRSEERAYRIAIRLLEERRPPNTFIALDEAAALGAARALKDRNLAGSVALIGFDSSLDEIKLLESGTLSAAIVQKPFNLGYLGVKTALKLIGGDRTEPVTYIESNVITSKNMYTPENQKLLFPFINNR
ncbi:substrate-binding domain-containing protein [Cohnella terricola]|uniref:Substrate-binding domain-containing protein n=1 Tax=Cohnella terricola TaxID=1289167 RepID=A0A559JBY4_9BACL|nr:substrate-binding domain-containing protein [Cohnella terricola]TVX97371.1 substrate-binding domain-containing protein [Cohnella terricola]